MTWVLQTCQWLEATRWSTALRESTWVYPVIESIHVLALCLFLGLAALLDFRLVGLTLRRVRVSEVAGRLMPWMVGGFVLMVITGGLLFSSAPVRFLGNVFFRIKTVLLLLAGLNAWIFHVTTYRRVEQWNTGATPRAARIAGSLSLVLWTGIVTAGRLIAYNWFN